MSDSDFLFDTNVWVALAFDSHPHHVDAVAAHGQASADHPAAFCRATQLSFLRVATTPAILSQYGAKSFTNRDALVVLNEILSAPTVAYRDEPAGLVAIWHKLAASSKASSKLWMDAYLAAFAIAGNYRFVTSDKAFKQFKGLDYRVLS